MEKIKQIIKVEWKGRQGDLMTDIVGLGEDGLVYKWHKSSGKWVLYVITGN